jgi:hypothetical protein
LRFDRSAIPAPHVECVGHRYLGGVEIESRGGTRSDRAECAGLLLPGRSETRVGRREEFAFLGGDQFLGLAQGGLRRLQIGIGNQRLLNQGIERARPEQPPPLARKIASIDEMLGLSVLHTGGGGGSRRQRLGRIARYFRRRRMLEIRTDGAARNQHRGRCPNGNDWNTREHHLPLPPPSVRPNRVRTPPPRLSITLTQPQRKSKLCKTMPFWEVGFLTVDPELFMMRSMCHAAVLRSSP